MNYTAALKRLSSTAVLAFVLNLAFSQAQPASYATGTQVNFVRSLEAAAPITSETSFLTASPRDVRSTTAFIDGIGRTLQQVVRRGSLQTGSLATDMVVSSIYDELGRERYKFLPFASTATDGAFKLNPFQQQASFYQSQLAGQTQSNVQETFYYGQTNFESSPLNRPQASFAPGNKWVGSGRGVSSGYFLNNGTADDVKRFSVTDVSNDWGTVSLAEVYGDNQLTKTVTTDENNSQVVEFKDKEGRILMKKVRLTASPETGNGAGYPGWLTTIYVYDDFGRLRLVVQPRGVEILLANGWDFNALSGIVLQEQCFRYEYNSRGQIIRKKVPGAGEVRMVYDSRDRLVLTQDANMRAVSPARWIYTTYDPFNRVETTGFWTDNAGRSFSGILTESANSATLISGATDELTRSYYNDYTWVPAPMTGELLGDWNSHYLPSGAYPYPIQPAKSSLIKGLVTGSRVKILGSSTYLYTVNIYDEYGRVIQMKSTNQTGGFDVVTTQYAWSGLPLVVIQKQDIQGVNANTTVTVTKMTYDDLGRVTNIDKKISNTLVNGGAMPSTWTTVSSLKYDKLGQVMEKKLGVNATKPHGLETQSMDYNIRGWLLGLNRTSMVRDGSASTFFGFELGYDKLETGTANISFGQEQYNGNISGMIWRSGSDLVRRKYNFSYDLANRLTQANFNEPDFAGSGIDYSVPNIKYDANGNITEMDQKGWIVSGSDFVDRLRYTYASNNNSNKLLNVNDISTTPSIRLGDFRTSPLHPQAGAKTTATVDYTYDDNGNLKKDLNKDIGSSSTDGIVYNYLNLPEQITMRNASGGTKGTIVYTYSAAGAKLQKQVTDYSESGRTITTTTQYIGAAVLESRVISPADAARPNYTNKVLFLGHEEGRIRFEEATTSTCPAQPARIFYDYFLKDHLGNVRMVLTEQSETKCYGAATVEDATWATENLLYNIVDGRRIAKTVEPGASGIASFGAKFYRTNGNNSNERTGLGIVLKVMKGDQVKITAESFYSIPGGNAGVPINLAASELLNALLGAKGFPVGKGLSSTDLAALNTPTSLQSFLNTNSGNSSLAKAAVNYALFDEQMRFVGGDYDPVPSGGGYKNHQKFFNTPVNITRSGYLYIYVSNESNLNVFFDNLNVSHTNGPILEETHYYPFGLVMAGISAKAITGAVENRKKFNDGTELENKEFADGSGLDLYSTSFRSLDPQLGRFWQVDPLSHSSCELSPYHYSSNNPILRNDPLGLKDSTVNKEPVNTAPPLETVTVTGFTTRAKKNIYWQLVTGHTDFSSVRNDNLRQWLYQYDALQKHLERVHDLQRIQEPIVYGVLAAPAIICLSELSALYQGGQFLVQVGGRLMPLKRIGFFLEDLQLRVWLQGNFMLNGVRSDIIAAFAFICFKDNPQKWEKFMSQSAEFKDLVKPIIDYMQKQGNNPSGSLMKKSNDFFGKFNF